MDLIEKIDAQMHELTGEFEAVIIKKIDTEADSGSTQAVIAAWRTASPFHFNDLVTLAKLLGGSNPRILMSANRPQSPRDFDGGAISLPLGSFHATSVAYAAK